MIKCRFIILFMVIIAQVSCDKATQPEAPKKTIFSLYSGSIDSSSIDVLVESFDTLDVLPIVMINSQQPDTVESQLGFYRATFRQLRSDSIVKFKLILSHDSIFGEFKVPGEIDSLFCNGRYISQNIAGPVVSIDTSASYFFTWKTKQKGDYFTIEYWSDSNNNADDNKYLSTTDTFITIVPERTGLTHSFLILKLENCIGKKTNVIPDKSSSTMDLYYHIRPSRYTCEIYMQ